MDPDILGPGNNRDAIPPIYQPQFESVESADSWLENDDLVGVLALDYEVHVYPLRMLVYHEVANDQIASVPVLVTFCPLCDTVIAFDRRVTGEALLFGVSRSCCTITSSCGTTKPSRGGSRRQVSPLWETWPVSNWTFSRFAPSFGGMCARICPGPESFLGSPASRKVRQASTI